MATSVCKISEVERISFVLLSSPLCCGSAATGPPQPFVSLVALLTWRDLLLCAKHLFVAAIGRCRAHHAASTALPGWSGIGGGAVVWAGRGDLAALNCAVSARRVPRFRVCPPWGLCDGRSPGRNRRMEATAACSPIPRRTRPRGFPRGFPDSLAGKPECRKWRWRWHYWRGPRVARPSPQGADRGVRSDDHGLAPLQRNEQAPSLHSRSWSDAGNRSGRQCC